MKHYQIESLIRPIVELPTACVSACVATAIGCCPELFWLASSHVPGVSMWQVMPWGRYVVVSVLAMMALRRFWDAGRIIRYQSHLKAQPYFAVRSDEIPRRSDALYLGHGFRWDDRHTRRLGEAKSSSAEPYLRRTWMDRILRAPEPARDDGIAAMHGVGSFEGADTPLWLTDAQRMGHILVLGVPGTGKSRLCELLVSQDITRGGPVIVLDPKGDKELMLQMFVSSIACGRGDDFICFHLAFPEFSARYNPFGNFARVTEIASRIRESIPDTGNSAAFAEFVWSYVNTIAVALHKLGRRTTIKSLLQHATNLDSLVSDYCQTLLDKKHPHWRDDLPAEVAAVPDKIKGRKLPQAYADRDPKIIATIQMVQQFQLGDEVSQALLKTYGHDRSHHEKLVSSLFPLLQKMSTGAIADILSPSYDDAMDARPILDFDSAIRSNKIVYIGLDALTDATVAKAVGSSMFADLTSIAGRIYNYTRDQGLTDALSRESPRVRIHADEFNEAIGESFVPLLNKARGAGFDVTAYTQSRADIAVGMGDVQKGAQIEDNFGTLVMMRVRSDATAKMLIDQLPEVMIRTVTWGSATSDGTAASDFTSSQTQRIAEQKVKLLTTADLVALPKGHAFVSGKGGQLFKVRFPLPLAESTTATVASMAKTLVERRQATGSQPWRETEAPWRDAVEGTQREAA